MFDPAAKAVGLDGLTPHELRNTGASLAIAAGANVKVLQTLLGHKTATLTLDRYGICSPTTWGGLRTLSTLPLKMLRTHCGPAHLSRL